MKRNTMLLIILIILISILFLGCTGVQIVDDKSDNLSYNHFIYNGNVVKQVAGEYNITPMLIEVNLINKTVDTVTLQTDIQTGNTGNISDINYIMQIDEYGEITDLQSTELVIPEVQFGLPNTIVYPPDSIHQNKVWIAPFNRNGSYESKDGLIEYEISGLRNYRCVGIENITTKLGTYSSYHIYSEINYTVNMTVYTANATIITNTTGTSIGEDLIESYHRFLIKSQYHVNEQMETEIENAEYMSPLVNYYYRQSQTQSDITCELTDIK